VITTHQSRAVTYVPQ